MWFFRSPWWVLPLKKLAPGTGVWGTTMERTVGIWKLGFRVFFSPRNQTLFFRGLIALDILLFFVPTDCCQPPTPFHIYRLYNVFISSFRSLAVVVVVVVTRRPVSFLLSFLLSFNRECLFQQTLYYVAVLFTCGIKKWRRRLLPKHVSSSDAAAYSWVVHIPRNNTRSCTGNAR